MATDQRPLADGVTEEYRPPAPDTTMSLDELLELKPTEGPDWDAVASWLERDHPDVVTALRADLPAAGIITPVTVSHDRQRLLNGHHRIVAARALGWEQPVPVIFRDHVDPAPHDWDPYTRTHHLYDCDECGVRGCTKVHEDW